MIDNYDSFTFNLVHYFRAIGQVVEVYRNDQISLAEIAEKKPEYLVISPGPCSPNEAGISLAAIAEFAGQIPILGVCLGHQCIAQHFGAKVIKADKVMHGKLSAVSHNNQGLFQQLNQPLRVTRYHSLIVDNNTLPASLEVTAYTENDNNNHEIMALQHKTLPIASVQFHPESVLTEQGHQLLNNFLTMYNNFSSC
jgi:anthranilate synthase/aminodeoxychorismate synthase-like glutamine amidotransferase